MSAGPSPRWNTAVVWFRRDLRLADHPALSEAITRARSVVPLFVLDDRLLAGPAASPVRSWFLRRSVADLDAALRARGSGLVTRSGRPVDVVPAVARAVGADAVLATRDVTPFSHRRDREVAEALAREGRELHLRSGLLLVEPEFMLTTSGGPYGVYTPFWRALQRAPRREMRRAPEHIATPAAAHAGSEERIDQLAGATPPIAALPEPGEAAAQHRLRTWVGERLPAYGEDRNLLSGDGTSRLGQDLHFGLLSPLQVETAAAEAGEEAIPFIRQLAWREFYHHMLFHRRVSSSRAASDTLMKAFRSEADDPEAVAAWREGRTGIPAVDAGMRQLTATSWLSNRARLVVASFLTRHLLMDYRIGERHFLRHLIDGDAANNLGGWQWTAGVGSDPQPWFRIFNPVLQGRRFDPEGDWVRRWVPELEAVPTHYIHAPWEMSADVAAEARVRLGETYPQPIVDLAEARARALAAFKSVTA